MKYESQQKNDYQTENLDKHQKNVAEKQYTHENDTENKRPVNQGQRKENDLENQRNTDQKHRSADQKHESADQKHESVSSSDQKNRHNN